MIEATLDAPLQIKQGDDFHLEMLWTDSEDVPIDMAGCAARMQLRRSPGAPVLLDLSTENGRIVLGVGDITLDVDAQATQGLTTPEGVFDLQITYSDGRIATILGGRFELIADVTYAGND